MECKDNSRNGGVYNDDITLTPEDCSTRERPKYVQDCALVAGKLHFINAADFSPTNISVSHCIYSQAPCDMLASKLNGMLGKQKKLLFFHTQKGDLKTGQGTLQKRTESKTASKAYASNTRFIVFPLSVLQCDELTYLQSWPL